MTTINISPSYPVKFLNGEDVRLITEFQSVLAISMVIWLISSILFWGSNVAYYLLLLIISYWMLEIYIQGLKRIPVDNIQVIENE